MFIAQLFIMIAASLGGAALLGSKIYALIAVVIAITATGCLLVVPGRFEDADELPLMDILQTILVGMFLGALWVALPLVVFIGAGRNRASHSDNAHPSPRPDECSARRRSEEG